MDEELETPPPSKLKTLLPLLAVLIVGLGGGAAVSTMMSGTPDPIGGHEGAAPASAGGAAAPAEAAHGAPAAAEHGAEGAAATAAAPASTITSLGRFTVNLRGSGGGRILQMEVSLEAAPSAGSALEALTPRLRDSINSAVSDYTWTELEGTDGKTRLKDELLTRVNGVADPIVVDAVYLTSFVVS